MSTITLAEFVLGSNTLLAIDTTVNMSYTFAGFTDYSLDVSGGALTFTSPSGTVSLPGTFLLRNDTHYYKYTVNDGLWTAIKTGPNVPTITVSLSYDNDLEVTWSVDPDAITGTYRLGFDTITDTDMVVTAPTTILAADLPPSFTEVIVGLYGAKGLLTSGSSSVVTTTRTTTTTTTRPPPTLTTNSTVTNVLAALESYSASEVLSAAISTNVSKASIMLAFAQRAATNGTSIFSAYAGTSFIGESVTISAARAAALYSSLGITGDNATKDIRISVPNAGVITLGSAIINTSLAIDDTVDATYTFAGYPNHTLSIAAGVQTFTSPSGSTVLSQGVTFTLTNERGGSVTYPVLHLDITFGKGVSVQPPVCFLGNAPVKTPSGYRRMDSLKVGDRVSTPTGTAVIQNIHCQDYAAGPSANPYVIPKGQFGATQELLISPRHKVAVNGHMVEARDLGLQQRDVGPLTYYNLGLKGANMIVAGVTVESLASMTRVTISRDMFNQVLASRYGGRMTPEIAAACHFLQDGTVSVPSFKKM